MGATDFDFLPGRWHIANRKLVDTLDPDCDEWEEFGAGSEARAMLGGAGNVDHFTTPGYEGFSLRLYDPERTCGGSGGPPRRARAAWTRRSRAASPTAAPASSARTCSRACRSTSASTGRR